MKIGDKVRLIEPLDDGWVGTVVEVCDNGEAVRVGDDERTYYLLIDFLRPVEEN